MTLISINEAAAQGISRLRKPVWANPFDHIKIDIFAGEPEDTAGPWIHLHAPVNRLINGHDPVKVVGPLHGSYDSKEFEAYNGPLPDSDEYQAEQAKFDRHADVKEG